MSQNLARLNMAMAEGLGPAEPAEASGAALAAAGAPTGVLQRRSSVSALLQPEVADGFAPPEGALGSQGSPRASGWVQLSDAAPSRSPALVVPLPPRGAPPDGAHPSSELLLRRNGASLQPILVGSAAGRVASMAADARLPPSPSDSAAGTDLRRAALLRSLQRRTGTGGGAPAVPRPPEVQQAASTPLARAGEDVAKSEDVAMAPPGDDELDESMATPLLLSDAAGGGAAHEAGIPPAAAQDEDTWVDGGSMADDAVLSMSPPAHEFVAPPSGSVCNPARDPSPMPPPPQLRLGPQWQPRA